MICLRNKGGREKAWEKKGIEREMEREREGGKEKGGGSGDSKERGGGESEGVREGVGGTHTENTETECFCVY